MFGLPAYLPLPFQPSASISSIIQSIQTFEITIAGGSTSNTQTITSVNTSNSVIFFNGFTTTSAGGVMRELNTRVELTNATTVTARRDTSSATDTVTARGTVVEFVSSAITSIQAGTLTVASSSSSGTATITSVNTSKAVVFYLGYTSTTTTTSPNTTTGNIELTNPTTITYTRNSTSAPILTVGYMAVEFASGILNSAPQQRTVTLAVSSTTSTDTITSVSTSNTILIYNGVSSATVTETAFLYNLQLTSATQVTLTRTGTLSSSRTIKYTVVEFNPTYVKSLQRNTTAIVSATSATATITSVNTSKAVCNFNNFSTTAGSALEIYATAKLNSSTQVVANKGSAGSTTSTPGWEVIEFV